MPSPRVAIVAGLAGFLLALIATWPLRWALAVAPDGVECAVPAGSLWRGQCAALRVGNQLFGSVRWDIHALQLLRGRFGGDVSVEQPGIVARGVAYAGATGALTLLDVKADLQLGLGSVERLAPQLRGAVTLDLGRVLLRDGWVRDLAGTVSANGLRQLAPQPMDLGSFLITFDAPPAADGRVVGRLQDRGGPLDVQGTLALLADPGYELTGSVAARPDAPPQIAEQIRFLGSPDASGRRAFSQSETF